MAWVKFPLISPLPANDEKAACPGWISGADSTNPSRSMATYWWKFCWATVSQAPEPDEVRL